MKTVLLTLIFLASGCFKIQFIEQNPSESYEDMKGRPDLEPLETVKKPDAITSTGSPDLGGSSPTPAPTPSSTMDAGTTTATQDLADSRDMTQQDLSKIQDMGPTQTADLAKIQDLAPVLVDASKPPVIDLAPTPSPDLAPVACGSLNQPCCTGSCGPGTECRTDNICHATNQPPLCGHEGTTCCAGPQPCNGFTGFGCHPGRNECVTCGTDKTGPCQPQAGTGQWCQLGYSLIGTGANARCFHCGLPGEYCCNIQQSPCGMNLCSTGTCHNNRSCNKETIMCM